MSTKTITLSESVGQWVEEQATSRQISADEFVEQLAREARERAQNAGSDDDPELERLLLEGINSGPGEPLDENWWKTVHAGVEARLQQQSARNGAQT